jgi:prophage maintenance system killer protein
VTLSAADLRFIYRVASARFGGSEPPDVDDDALAAAVAQADGATPYARAAALVAYLLDRRVFPAAALQAALLTLHCALALDGLSLLAPQGAAAGMVRELSKGGDADMMARWLEDRAVPSAGV